VNEMDKAHEMNEFSHKVSDAKSDAQGNLFVSSFFLKINSHQQTHDMYAVLFAQQASNRVK
jgi:hypothetical protein